MKVYIPKMKLRRNGRRNVAWRKRGQRKLEKRVRGCKVDLLGDRKIERRQEAGYVKMET